MKVQAQIRGESPTPKEIWDRLIKLGVSEPEVLVGLLSRHASTGKPIDEEEQVRLFLEAVGSGFEIWKRLKRAEVRRGLTIEDLSTDFQEEVRNEQRESAFASKAKGGSKSQRKEARSCYKCGKKGHIAKGCWSKKDQESNRSSKSSTLNMTASVFNSNRDHKTAWLIDSGASAHICCQAELFEALDTSQQPPLDGLGGVVRAEGVGTVRLTIRNTDTTLILRDVHLVPSFFTNLISVKRLQSSKDARLIYDGSAWKVIHTPSGTKVASSKNYQGMYALDAHVQKALVNAVMENQSIYGMNGLNLKNSPTNLSVTHAWHPNKKGKY
ncbi:hypothetical protein V1524DRAFT_466668 [Lipomyces starkeyi]